MGVIILNRLLFQRSYSVIERAGDYECANSILMYIRPDKNLEEIFIKGPISEDLEFQVRCEFSSMKMIFTCG